YGAVGGMPMPSFAELARFDHGEELGAKVGWGDPPSIFVAPTGRYVASESMGIKTNPVGGVTAFQPLVRIWDSHIGGEIARFRRHGVIFAAFAPTDDILATALWPIPDKAAEVPSPHLSLWDLRPQGPRIEETRQSAVLTLTPLPVSPD